MDGIILPAMTYGAETWSFTKKQIDILAVAQRNMERSTLGITRRDRWRNENIRAKTAVCDNTKKIHSLKWSWAGHLARTNDWLRNAQNGPQDMARESVDIRGEDGGMISKRLPRK